MQVVGALSLLAALTAVTVPGGSAKDAGGMVPAPRSRLDDVFIRLHGIPEKCLIEDLPEKTVLLGTARTRRRAALSLTTLP